MAEIKTDLNHKYKDRDPLETIQIIKNFFKNQKLKIIETKVKKTEIDTYWCGIDLYNNNQLILHVNGKGTSKAYCLASGYGELYERYCAGFGTWANNIFLLKNKYEKNFLEKGYYIDPEEKFQSFNQIYNSCKKFKDFFSNIDNEFFILKFFNLLQNQNKEKIEALTIPYIDFNNNSNKKYFNNFILENFSGSDGLSAGNTLEEALIQGLSEVYEHYVFNLLYNNRQNIYYLLDLNKIYLSDYLKCLIQKIQQKGYRILIYDLSYNYQVPVLLTIIVNLNNHSYYLNLGAHPIFSIALERTLTEIYQGVLKINNDNLNKINFYPSKFISKDVILSGPFNNLQDQLIYPEEILYNKCIINTYNKEIFLEDKEYSNQELILKYQQINKLNKFNVFYKDISCSNDIFTIRIFIDNIPFFCNYNIQNNIQLLKLKYNIYSIFFNQEKKENLFLLCKNFSDQAKNIDNKKIYYHDIIFTSPLDNFLYCSFNSIEDFFNDLQTIIFNNTINKDLLESFKYYFMIFLYKKDNYSISEIKSLFSFLNFDIKNFLLDYNNIFNLQYLFNQIILKNFNK